MGERLGFLEQIGSQILACPPLKDAPLPTEERLTWNTPLVAGSASSVRVRQGLEMLLTNVTGKIPCGFELVHQPRGLEVGFNRRTSVRISDRHGTDLGAMQGSFCVSQVKEPTPFRCQVASDHGECTVVLELEPSGLADALGLDELPAPFASVLDSAGPYTFSKFPMTAQMFRTVDELAECRLLGPMRRLYFESKALELLVLAVEATGPELQSALEPRDSAERLEHARALLLEDFAHPPTLRSLARACGLNERKLKQGFKQRFGTTVFGFVRAQRMSQAHEMLSASRHSVTEVAQLVGYANPSKFAAAFRREFGIAPSTVGAA